MVFGISWGAWGLNGGIGSSLIQSIQQITVTIGSSNTSGTASISAVNTSNTVLIWDGQITNSTGNLDGGAAATLIDSYIQLTNSTTVTATRQTSDTATVTVYLTVLEFKTGVLTSNQSGTISFSSASSATATISSITTANAVCLFQGFTTSDTTSQNVLATVEITNSTTITAAVGSGGGSSRVVAYTVVEISPTYFQSIQKFAISIGNSTSTNQTITSVTTSNTMLLYGGIRIGGSGSYRESCYLAQLTSTTNIQCTNSISTASTKTFNVTVLEWKGTYINSLQRGTTNISGSATQNATITAVNTSNSVSNFCGFYTDDNAVGDASKFFAATRLQSTTANQSLVNSAPSPDTIALSWEVVEFK